MNNVAIGSSGQIACQIDFGSGRQLDLEFPASDRVWMASGSGIETIDLWVKTILGKLDLRVSVRRTQTGIEVAIDRGHEGGPWWPADGIPRLIVETDPDLKTATVSCQVGLGNDRREALLGTMPLGPG